MAPLKQFKSDLDASSYQLPGGGDLYAPMRKTVVNTATAMGYDSATMVEIGVNWSDDLDPFGHVKGHAYPHFATACNVRVFQSFEEQLKEKFESFMSGQNIGVLARSFTVRLMSQVRYPDSLIIAQRLKEVLPDRYFAVTTVWSLSQQAIVAEASGYIVFFDHEKGKLANLLEAGGVYADLYHALVKRKDREEEIGKKWEAGHPKKEKSKI